MSDDVVVTSSVQTGQKDNPELRARAEIRKLKDKENRTLAEQLLLATAEETMTYKYKGIDIEIRIPTSNELDVILKTFNKYTQGKDEEDPKESFNGLCDMVASLMVDDSLNSDLLKSGNLGVSFIPKFMNEIQEYEKRTVEEVTVIKGFRRK